MNSEENTSEPCSGAGYVASSILIEQAYTVRHAIDLHMHGLCMRVAVRVLHSCAFIYEVINAGSLCMRAG